MTVVTEDPRAVELLSLRPLTLGLSPETTKRVRERSIALRAELWETYAPPEWQEQLCPHHEHGLKNAWPHGLTHPRMVNVLDNVPIIQRIELLVQESVGRYNSVIEQVSPNELARLRRRIPAPPAYEWDRRPRQLLGSASEYSGRPAPWDLHTFSIGSEQRGFYFPSQATADAVRDMFAQALYAPTVNDIEAAVREHKSNPRSLPALAAAWRKYTKTLHEMPARFEAQRPDSAIHHLASWLIDADELPDPYEPLVRIQEDYDVTFLGPDEALYSNPSRPYVWARLHHSDMFPDRQ